jgi:hypothetical protein
MELEPGCECPAIQVPGWVSIGWDGKQRFEPAEEFFRDNVHAEVGSYLEQVIDELEKRASLEGEE